MGQQILYCWKCNVRILGSELENGKAAQLGNRASCAACLPDLIDTLQPEERKAYQSRQAALKTPPSTPRIRASSTTIRPSPMPPRSRSGLIAAGAGGAVVTLAILAALSSSPPKPAPAPAAPKPAAVEVSPKELAAREAVAKAKAAKDLEPRIKLWQEAVWASEGTSTLDDARRGLAAALSERSAAIEKDFLELSEAARAPLRDEEYGKAIALLEEGKRKRDEPDWRLRIDKRIAEIRTAAAERLPILVERAMELKRRESTSDLREIEERVARWGMSEHLDTLRSALAKVPSGRPFTQGVDGLLVIEAERFGLNQRVGDQAWTEVQEPAGFAGTGAMRCLPMRKARYEKAALSSSPYMDYAVSFVKTGRHYVWARGQAPSQENNSLTLALDGVVVKSAEVLYFPSYAKDWNWTNAFWPKGVVYVDIDKPGPRLLRVYVREDGLAIDRLVFTPDPKWKPEGSGPPESPR